MKALTLQDPYATLVARGVKTIETRSWATRYRGPLAIHASKRVSAASRADARDVPEIARALRRLGCTDLGALPRGAIVATCELIDVLPVEQLVAHADLYLPGDERAFGDYSRGRYGWVLVNVTPFATPIPARGALGLWTFDLSGSCPR